ncbi:hypothetical protein C8R44DRAFT_980700 [Mycena epipterygia]|nr:hypothetical protein C8R44DRAFT_980700 [Mycena epipterygia]
MPGAVSKAWQAAGRTQGYKVLATSKFKSRPLARIPQKLVVDPSAVATKDSNPGLSTVSATGRGISVSLAASQPGSSASSPGPGLNLRVGGWEGQKLDINITFGDGGHTNRIELQHSSSENDLSGTSVEPSSDEAGLVPDGASQTGTRAVELKSIDPPDPPVLWKPNAKLLSVPPLPQIVRNDISLEVFTHRSYSTRPTHPSENLPRDPMPNNRRLELAGDSVLGLVMTDLILEMYPGLPVGPSAKMRSILVGNATLARISSKYKLADRAMVYPATRISSPNLHADIFEAYIGGLYADQGLERVKTWLNDLFRPLVPEVYEFVSQHEPHLLGKWDDRSADPSAPPPLPPPAGLTKLNDNLRKSAESSDISPASPHSPPPAKLIKLNDPPGKTAKSSDNLPTSSPSSPPDEPIKLNDHPGKTAKSSDNLPASSPSPPAGTVAISDAPSDYPVRDLNEYAFKSRQQIEWVCADSESEPDAYAPWSAIVLLDGEVFGRGGGNTKKAARDDASRQALVKIGVLNIVCVRWALGCESKLEGHLAPPAGTGAISDAYDYPVRELNEYAVKSHQQIEWVSEPEPDASATTQLGPAPARDWSAMVLLHGEVFGRGGGTTKKAARDDAARQALVKIGVIHIMGVRWVLGLV